MSKRDPNLPLIGGIAAALGAGLCCVGPFVLVTLGVSGAWIANLTLLEPYRPFFIAAALALFGWAGWNVYRPLENCGPDTICAVPLARKRHRRIFWLAAAVALVPVAGAYWIPWFA